MPQGTSSSQHQSWDSGHAAPTLADIELAPRRRLRDGTSSTSSSRRSSARGSSTAKRQRTMSSRSTLTDDESVEHELVPQPTAEESRRLPRLQAAARARPRPSHMFDSDSDGSVSSSDGIEAVGVVRPPAARVDNGGGASGAGSSRRDSDAGTSTSSPQPRRFTAQEKGKGRAQPEPASSAATPEVFEIEDSDDDEPAFEQSIQFISAVPAPIAVDDDPHSPVIEEDAALTAYNCPVCFCNPTTPAMTPCGHVLCYSCLHSSLLASIGRLPNPHVGPEPARGGRRGRGRGRGRGGRGRGNSRLQPTQWDTQGLGDALSAELDEQLRTHLAESGMTGTDAEAVIEGERADRERDGGGIEHPLKGLWQIGGGQWIIEGECPVCRKAIPGGLGPLGSNVGGVIVLEARVAYA